MTPEQPPKAAGVTDIKLNRNRRSNAPVGMECFICGSIFIGDESHEFCRVCDEACNSGKVPTIAGLQEALAAVRTAAPSAPSGDVWAPSGKDYDRNIHHNPDAKAWTDFFVETFPGLADKHGLMLGWFANAMMAMHDSMKSAPPAPIVSPEGRGEPVAWVRYKQGLDTYIDYKPDPKIEGSGWTPLFTHPAPTPTGDGIDDMAWQIYCEETSGDMDVRDFWHELSEDVRTDYRGKALRLQLDKVRAHPQPQAVGFDVEAMLKACVPGGDICNPQHIADAVREYVTTPPTDSGAAASSAKGE